MDNFAEGLFNALNDKAAFDLFKNQIKAFLPNEKDEALEKYLSDVRDSMARTYEVKSREEIGEDMKASTIGLDSNNFGIYLMALKKMSMAELLVKREAYYKQMGITPPKGYVPRRELEKWDEIDAFEAAYLLNSGVDRYKKVFAKFSEVSDPAWS